MAGTLFLALFGMVFFASYLGPFAPFMIVLTVVFFSYVIFWIIQLVRGTSGSLGV